MLRDYLKFAIDGIRHRSLRSWLTMIGIFVGIAAVVALLYLTQGLQVTIDDQLQKAGADRVVISPGGGLETTYGPFMSEFVAAKLDGSDLDVIRRVKGVEGAVGAIITVGEIRYKGKKKSESIFAFPTDLESKKFLEEMDFFVVDQGRYLRDSDKYQALVGVDTGDVDFGEELSLGDKLIVEGHIFNIVGIHKKTGNPVHDVKVTIPFETAKELYNKSDEFAMISVKVKKGFEPSDVAEDIKKKLRRHRGVKEGEEDFSVETAENVVASFKGVISIIETFAILITLISILVAVFGIMTTMYTAVLERTRQIGIMKAIGARNINILSLFVIEAVMLGFVGGVIGITLGFLVGNVFEWVITKGVNIGIAITVPIVEFTIGPQIGPFIEVFRGYVPTLWIILILLGSSIVGCVSGLLPAYRASKLNAVDALGYK